MGISKRYRDNFEKIDIDKDYLLDDAIEILSTSAKVKFDESVDLKEVTTDEESFRKWDGIDEDWEDFNREKKKDK